MYYLKGKDVMTTDISSSSSWIMKHIMQKRDYVNQMEQLWDDMISNQIFSMKKVYCELIEDNTRVSRSHLRGSNYTRHRDVLVFWLACHRKLATKDRLIRFEMIQDSSCSLCCNADESINHLLF
jgi:hypothetical protein